MSVFIGSGVAVCTPFTADGAFNGSVYEELIRFHVERGTDAIVSCGTTGEAPTLSEDEHIDVVVTAVHAAKKYGAEFGRRLPVIAGAGGNDTAKCCDMGRKLQSAGADALMFVAPYYNKTSQKGLVAHFVKIAASVDLPIVVYNVESRTSLNIFPETMEKISKLPNIAAVKEASGDIDQIGEIIERCGERLDIYSGNDGHILPVLSLGGKGVISTVGNIAPKAVHDLIAKFSTGDIVGSRELQLGILPLVRLLFADVNPMPVKAALNLMGMRVGECRLPLTSIEDSHRDELGSEMKRYGLI